ncbi:MAG: helix-turn-helix transcriptional regulator [Raoultibacter sp.]
MKRPVPVRSKLAAQRIGENLATWRKLTGSTSQQVADRAGVSRSTVSRLENGDSSVSFATFLNVCRAMDVLDRVVDATDPYETDLGRARADQAIPQRVRRK